MALLFMDGFDYYTSNGTLIDTFQLSRHWLGNDADFTFIRPGRQNNAFSNNLSLSQGLGTQNLGNTKSLYLGNLATVILGFACLKANVVSAERIITFSDGMATQCTLRTDSNSNLVFVTGEAGATQATGSLMIRSNIWYYIEVKLTIGNGTGSVQVRVNEQNDIHDGGGPVTGLDTQTTANAFVNSISLEGNSGDGIRFDDLYILNTTPSSPGPTNDDFLGDVAVETLFANANGATNNWTPLSGSNYENIDGFMDDDTNYVTTNTPGDIDLYAYESLVQIDQNSIYGVQLNPLWRKTAAGGRTARNLIRHNGINNNGITVPIRDSYAQNPEIFTVNPGTGSSWTISNIDNAQFGVELVT